MIDLLRLQALHCPCPSFQLLVENAISSPTPSPQSYVIDPCGQKYTEFKQQITEEEYVADTGLDYAPWCHSWPNYFTGPNGATVTVRSTQDPYAVAGSLTNCTFKFSSTPKHLTTLGIGLMIPGMVMSMLAYFCLAGACSMSDFGLGDFGGEATAPLTGGRKGAAYGATGGSVELGKRMLDQRVM